MKCGLFAALFAALFIALLGGSSASAFAPPVQNIPFDLEEVYTKVDDETETWQSGAYSDWRNLDHAIYDRDGTWLYVSFSRADERFDITDHPSGTTFTSRAYCAFRISNLNLDGCSYATSGSNPAYSAVAQEAVFHIQITEDRMPYFQEFRSDVIDYYGDFYFQDNREVIRPDFTYSVIDKEITAKDHKNDLPEFVPDEGYTFNGYEVEWSLFKDTELVNHQILLQEKDYKFTVDEYGSYKLEARYLVQQCFRYPGYPETPDYCFYVDLGTEFEDINFTSTAVNLEIDGSSTSGNTTMLDCDVAGVCSLPEKTPAALFFSGLDNLNTHGLTQFFTAPITFLGTLPSKAESCTPISFPLLGETISIECLKPRYYAWSETIMNIYTTLLIAGTGYLIAFNVFRNIKDINTPDKDKIEVARL